jgi:tRNA 2-selenouridine synthase
MPKYCHITEFLSLMKDIPAIDVRSPSEFATGQIPGSKSVPLMSDEQRAMVGTTYKQKGKFEAIELGFNLVGPNIGEIIKQSKTIAPAKEVLIYCWRGGMRSANVAWLLESNGFSCTLLEGGYKAYRQYGKSLFSKAYEIYIIGGFTGSNKTKVLHALAEAGEQILDIEAIARHRGSSFGMIGQKAQHPNELFENLLIQEWIKFDKSRRVWIEDESKILGSNHIPDPLFHLIRNARVFKLQVEKKQRAKNLFEIYGLLENAELEKAIRRIERKIGGQNVKLAVKALEERDYETVADIALSYYDKTYSFGLSKRAKDTVTEVIPHSNDPAIIARQLIELVKKNN